MKPYLNPVQARAWEIHRERGHPKGYDGPCWGPTPADVEQAAIEMAPPRKVVPS